MTTAIDFYVIKSKLKQDALVFACEWLENAAQQGNKIDVHFASKKEAENFDALLWTFKEDSFIPHQLTSADNHQSAILLSFPEQRANRHEILINFTSEIPDNFQDYQQLIEIVFDDPAMQQLARSRYKHYRDAGASLKTHKINE